MLPASGKRADIQANAQYGGSGMDRNLFDTLVSVFKRLHSRKGTHTTQLNRVQDFIGDKQLSEKSAKEAHRRVYVAGEGSESGSKTLGGAAAYQAYL